MKEIDEESIYKRLDRIEELIKLLMVNSLIDDFKIEQENNTNQNESFAAIRQKTPQYPKDIMDTLDLYCMKITRTDIINGFDAIFLSLDENVKYVMNDFLYIDEFIKNYNERYIPIFCFSSLNGMRRKRFVEENISYATDIELFVCKK